MMYISEKNKHFNSLSMQGFHTNVLKKFLKVWNFIKFDTIFASNKTHHASHLNSAPGWVFDFYGGHVS